MTRFSLLLFASLPIAAIFGQASIHPELTEAWLLDDRVEVLIVMDEQPDPFLADALRDKSAKGSYVFELAARLAERSQLAVRTYLNHAAIAHRPFRIVNALWAYLTEAEAIELSRLAGVARINPNPWIRQDLGWEAAPGSQARSAVEWGVDRVGAPTLWAQGIRGAGAVVGGQDTGYEWDHPALVNQYRGNSGDTVLHDYHWHDAIRVLNPLNNGGSNPCGLDSPAPCDDNDHGTHTMGTMVGDDGEANQIGLAPEARWMACRNMERGWGSPASYIECFEFFLAPTRVDGTEPDPGMAPHVIANSWSCPEVEGCLPENFDLMEIAIDNLRAAGVVVVTSAGNSGPNCETVNAPPSIFAGSFAVGATAISDSIAGFSSRGPVGLDGSGRLQPQVVAPGVSVRSAKRNGQYGFFSGTSMAGPHVAGAVALLISARPELAGRVSEIEEIFRRSARLLFSNQDCGDFPGDQSPNAVYGHGLIDLEAALVEADVLLSTGNIADENINLSVFPNPVQGLVNVLVDNEYIQELTLYDMLGRPVRTDFTLSGQIGQLSMEALPTGSYLLEIRTESGSLMERIVKQ